MTVAVPTPLSILRSVAPPRQVSYPRFSRPARPARAFRVFVCRSQRVARRRVSTASLSLPLAAQRRRRVYLVSAFQCAATSGGAKSWGRRQFSRRPRGQRRARPRARLDRSTRPLSPDAGPQRAGMARPLGLTPLPGRVQVRVWQHAQACRFPRSSPHVLSAEEWRNSGQASQKRGK